MEKYEFVKVMNENRILISKDGSRFVVTTEMSGNIRQALVFYCNRSGNVTDWTPVDADSSIQSFMNSKVTGVPATL
jgi:hypothetical protein